MNAFSFDINKFRDLGRFSKGSFVYDGEIYINVGISDADIIKGLIQIANTHPDDMIKIKALQSLVVIITDKIIKKHCK